MTSAGEQDRSIRTFGFLHKGKERDVVVEIRILVNRKTVLVTNHLKDKTLCDQWSEIKSCFLFVPLILVSNLAGSS